jgi:hypothetical protein
MEFKNFSIGIGSSNNKNPYQAAKLAADEAVKLCGKVPVFSIVHTNADFDQKEILKGINEVLGTKWIGCSVDKQILSSAPYSVDTVVSVVSIYTKYMHFGVGVSDNYRKNPEKSGKEAIISAMKSVETDKYVDSYVQFTRAKTKDYSSIVKTPPYFIFALVGSIYKNKGEYVPGAENKFLSGLLQNIGPHIPIFGIGSGSNFDKFTAENVKDTRNYQFANGKMYTDAGVVAFVVSNILFDIDVQHGYNVTNNFVAITKLDKNGFDILELNGKPAIDEYCRLINVKKEDYLKDSFYYSLRWPLGLVALDGSTYIKEVFPNPDNKTLHCEYLLRQNMIMNVLEYDKKTLYTTMPKIITDSKNRNENKKIALAFFCNCCGRRALLAGDEAKVSKKMLDSNKGVPWFGCYSFIEIGSTMTNVAQVHGETVTSLILYDSLLTE